MLLRAALISGLFITFTACTSEKIHEPAPWDQWTDKFPSWVAPFPPFTVIDNIHYVGTEGVSSFLITGADGHILLDGGLPQNAPIIANNIKTLGFDIG